MFKKCVANSYAGLKLFSIVQNLNPEEDGSDIKSFITRDSDEGEFNEETEEDGESEEPKRNVSNYSEVVNQIKQLAISTVQKGNVDGLIYSKQQEFISKNVFK